MELEQAEELIEIALDARLQAYAPYSHFLVGAAVLASSGQIFPGCNVENASFGLAICAERSAVCNMVVARQRGIRAIAIASRGGVTPCGACRQFLSEFGMDIDILCVNEVDRSVHCWSLSELLPGAFRLEG